MSDILYIPCISTY